MIWIPDHMDKGITRKMTTSFVMEKRFVLDTLEKPSHHCFKRQIALILKSESSFDVEISDIDRYSESCVQKNIILHSQNYSSFKDPHITDIVALLYTSNSVRNVLYGVFYNIVVLPAITEKEHFMRRFCPSLILYYENYIVERNNDIVKEIMTT